LGRPAISKRIIILLHVEHVEDELCSN